MIKITAKSTGFQRFKITTYLDGSDEMLIAEIVALHKHLLETKRGTNIISTAMDQLQEYLHEVNEEKRKNEN